MRTSEASKEEVASEGGHTARLIVRIDGHVQGVAFRVLAEEQAKALDLVGSARNNADGSLTIEIQGSKRSLDRFLAWAKRGPETARITHVTFTFDRELKPFREFTIE